MKNLLEISRIVTKKKVRKIEIMDDASLDQKNSKFREFYEGLMSGKYKNDRDAATHLYGCSPTDDKYRQLKSRFRKRLLNTLFFLDVNVPDTSSYDRAYFSCHKDWTLVKILLSNGAEQTGAELARQILTVSLRYKFADLVVNCARILRKRAASELKERDFEEYDQNLKEFSRVLEAETRSEELFQRVMMKFNNPDIDLANLREQIDGFCDSLVVLSEEFDSPVILYNMYLVWIYRYEMMRDYDGMLEVCHRAEKYIQENPLFYQDEKLAAFQLKKMSAFLHRQDFKTGKTSAEKSLQSFREGSAVWFEFMEYYLLLSFHTENFIHALAIFNRAKNEGKFKRLDSQKREKWKIYEVYLNYFLETSAGGEDLFKNPDQKVFNVSRFLNDPILYPKELRVFTVHLVVAQILFLLDRKNFQPAKERIERLKSYSLRQLSKEEHFRMIQFIRLLQQLAKADFNPSQLTGTEKYYNRLTTERPFFYRGLLNELEIVPFEKLWHHILDKLR